MAAHAERTLARMMAVQLLYQAELSGERASDLAALPSPLPDGGPLPGYAARLACGVEEHLAEIDALIAAASQNWSVERMPACDRAIMRMAVYEMRHCEDVPDGVCINEAVELAKQLGGEDDSSRFVNGILGAVSRSAVPANGGDLDAAADAGGSVDPTADSGADAAAGSGGAGAEEIPASPGNGEPETEGE